MPIPLTENGWDFPSLILIYLSLIEGRLFPLRSLRMGISVRQGEGNASQTTGCTQSTTRLLVGSSAELSRQFIQNTFRLILFRVFILHDETLIHRSF